MKKIILTLIILFLSASVVRAQIIEKPPTNILDPNPGAGSAKAKVENKGFIPMSPTAASLGIFGQIPVGNYTGTAEINIPLYEIKYKDLSIPITISYHASGVKPDLMPGSTGLGWALQAGGAISRTVMGAPDHGDYDELKYGDMLFPTEPDRRGEDDWTSNKRLTTFLEDKVLTSQNSDPDVFYFNINGHTGRFYMNHKDSVEIQSNQGESFLITSEKGNLSGRFQELPQTLDLKKVGYINRYNPDIILQNSLKSFTMTDSKGIRYTFGGSFKSIECI